MLPAPPPPQLAPLRRLNTTGQVLLKRDHHPLNVRRPPAGARDLGVVAGAQAVGRAPAGRGHPQNPPQTTADRGLS